MKEQKKTNYNLNSKWYYHKLNTSKNERRRNGQSAKNACIQEKTELKKI